MIFANDTGLFNNVHNVEILHSEYTILRNDREGHGGSVMLGIRAGLFKTIHEIEHNYDLEYFWCNLLQCQTARYLFVRTIVRQTQKEFRKAQSLGHCCFFCTTIIPQTPQY